MNRAILQEEESYDHTTSKHPDSEERFHSKNKGHSVPAFRDLHLMSRKPMDIARPSDLLRSSQNTKRSERSQTPERSQHFERSQKGSPSIKFNINHVKQMIYEENEVKESDAFRQLREWSESYGPDELDSFVLRNVFQKFNYPFTPEWIKSFNIYCDLIGNK